MVNEKQELEFGAACFHIALKFLENPSEGAAPFSRTSYIMSFEEVKILDLYEIDGVPHFAMVQQPEEIVVINLNTKSVATLACNDNELYLHNVSYNITKMCPPLTIIIFLAPPHHWDSSTS